MVGGYFGLTEDDVIEFAIDSKENINLVGKLFAKNGIRSLLVQYQMSQAPGIGGEKSHKIQFHRLHNS